MIAKHDPDADFVAGFQDKVISFLYDRKNKKCTTGVWLLSRSRFEPYL